MRLIAGQAKGRRLHVPRGLRVRPSGARWRESAFGILDHRDAISGSRVLDLFAGTGALGLEALSRGASHLIAVDQDPEVAHLLEENVAICGFADRVEVRVEAAERALARLGAQDRIFDLVLLDPPYRQGWIAGVLSDLVEQELLADGARVLIEHAREETVDPAVGYDVEVQRRCGDSHLALLRRRDSALEEN